MEDQELLRSLLNGPCSHFKKFGQDDYRDPAEKNPSGSLSSKGFYDHRINQSIPLRSYAKDKGISMFDKNSNKVEKIWEESELIINQETSSYQYLKKYLLFARGIKEDNFNDLLEEGFFRLNEYQDKKQIIHPILSPKESILFLEKGNIIPRKINRIFIHDSGHPSDKKKQLGTLGKEPGALILPPKKRIGSNKKIAILEGLEDALTLRGVFEEHTFLITCQKNGFDHAEAFLESDNYSECLIIADHDLDEDAVQTSQSKAFRLGRRCMSKCTKVDVKMPSEPKFDANDALMKSKLDGWISALIPIPKRFQIEDPKGYESDPRPSLVAKVAVAEDENWSEPIPLIQNNDISEKYPIKALPSLIRGSVEEFLYFNTMPDSMVASVALASASLSTQHIANVEIDGRSYPINLFFLVSQKSGERKTTVLREFSEPFYQWEKENEMMRPQDTPLSQSSMLYEDITKESWIVEMSQGHESAALWSDEAAILIGSYGMAEKDVMGFFGVFNKAFYGERINSWRKTTQSVRLSGYRLTILLMMQPGVMTDLFRKGSSNETGFAEETGFLTRFLMCAPPSLIGHRPYVPRKESTPQLDRFKERVKELINQKVPNDWDQIKKLSISKEAKELWIEKFNDSEMKCRNGEIYEDFGGFVSKHAELAARIAGVFHVFENQENEIDAVTMRNAFQIAEWHLNESVRILSNEKIPSDIKNAINLIDWFGKKPLERSKIMKGELLKRGPARLRNRQNLNPVIELLKEHHYLRINEMGKNIEIEVNPIFLDKRNMGINID